MRKPTKLSVITLAFALLLAACGGDDAATDDTGADETTTTAAPEEETTTTAAPETEETEAPEEPAGDLTGSIEASGSSTVEPITASVAEKFNGVNPGVAISVEGPGTGDGFARFCAGETDVQDASRAIKDEEVAACEESGVEYVELLIAYDGLSVITSVNNELVSCLNLGDLYALIGPESEGFSNWSDANDLAAEVGGTGNFPDAPLNITAPGEESGTFDAFVELALQDIGEERLGDEYESNPTRADYNPSANDNVIVENIGAEDTALGWVGLAFAEENKEVLKEIAIDGGAGCVDPTVETVADGSYPLSRPLFIYVNTAKAAEKPELVAFIDYYLGEGISSVGEVGYVSLPSDILAATATAWDGAKG